MTPTEIRVALAEILRKAGVYYLAEQDVQQQFIDGTVDPKLQELDMDSLGVMELCIALEVDWNIMVVPDDLRQMKTLGDVVSFIERKAP